MLTSAVSCEEFESYKLLRITIIFQEGRMVFKLLGRRTRMLKDLKLHEGPRAHKRIIEASRAIGLIIKILTWQILEGLKFIFGLFYPYLSLYFSININK